MILVLTHLNDSPKSVNHVPSQNVNYVALDINPFPTIKTDIPNIIGKFKAGVSRIVGNAFMHSEKLWQLSYHDHVIRGDKDYLKIWEYIDTNVMKWQDDCFFTDDTHKPRAF